MSSVLGPSPQLQRDDAEAPTILPWQIIGRLANACPALEPEWQGRRQEAGKQQSRAELAEEAHLAGLEHADQSLGSPRGLPLFQRLVQLSETGLSFLIPSS